MRRIAREVGEENIRENAEAGVRRAEQAVRYLDAADAGEDGIQIAARASPGPARAR
jgi:hypothetical protein